MTAPASTARDRIGWHDLPRVQVIRAVSFEDQAAAFEIRRRVFADEQGVADLRVSDTDDPRSLIALARIPEREGSRDLWRPVSTGRLTPATTRDGQALIAWVATLPEVRGQGAGSALMRFLLAAADAAGTNEVALAAQAPAELFYRRLGFMPAGPLYDVRGIPHLRMVRRRPQ